ncbi:MAG: HD domain-containing protein [Synechococcaceae cyanobacterium SM2_3_2]|nr:HD domain-containing protein [Synechococcaceae cyanobacterium SM2_3_2]
MEEQNLNALHRYTKALIVALGHRDLLTRLHADRVQRLAEEMGLRCGLTKNEIYTLRIAASFHDIGKIGIPDRVLLKPAKLDAEERKIIEQHSEIGEKIMLSTELDGSQQVALLIRHHHEHYNGMGYPDGLSGESIPICNRIISIADSYDAMAMTRTYHTARTHQEIMTILEEETGEKHDPEIMHIFCDFIETSQFRAVKTNEKK